VGQAEASRCFQRLLLDSRRIDCTRLSTSSSRIKRKDWTRLALNSCRMLIFRSSLQRDPYEAKPMPLSPYVKDWRVKFVGREAKLMSWVFMISAAASGTSPSFRSMTGPNFLDKAAKQ
ncbi:hypothetical protein MUK42_29245, partial [Musa troglodytarum]